MKLVYITSGNDIASVSQVWELVNHYSKHNLLNNISIITDDISHSNNANKNIKVYKIKHFPGFGVFNSTIVNEYKYVLSKIKIDKNTIFHARNPFTAYYLCQALQKNEVDCRNVLVDIRGAVLEELMYYPRFNRIINKLKEKHVKKALFFLKDLPYSCVTKELKKYVIDNFHFKTNNGIINHSLVPDSFKYSEQKRLLIRKRLKLKNEDICIVFSTGNNDLWQNTINIVNKLSLIPNIKILLLSKNRLPKYNNVITKFITYHDMPEYLSAADIAVIKRENNIVNRVASPIKYSEYLACGLPILADNSVQLIKDDIRQHRHGIIVDDLSNIKSDTIKQLLAIDRNRISKIGRSLYGINNISQKYLRKYHEIIYSN